MLSESPANPPDPRRIAARRQLPQHNQRLDIQPGVPRFRAPGSPVIYCVSMCGLVEWMVS